MNQETFECVECKETFPVDEIGCPLDGRESPACGDCALNGA